METIAGAMVVYDYMYDDLHNYNVTVCIFLILFTKCRDVDCIVYRRLDFVPE